jgi:hypothetical protein
VSIIIIRILSGSPALSKEQSFLFFFVGLVVGVDRGRS